MCCSRCYEEEDDGGTLHDVGIDWERFEGDLLAALAALTPN